MSSSLYRAVGTATGGAEVDTKWLIQMESDYLTQLEDQSRVLKDLFSQLLTCKAALRRKMDTAKLKAETREKVDAMEEKTTTSAPTQEFVNLQIVDDLLQKAQKVRAGLDCEDKPKKGPGIKQRPLSKPKIVSASRTSRALTSTTRNPPPRTNTHLKSATGTAVSRKIKSAQSGGLNASEKGCRIKEKSEVITTVSEEKRAATGGMNTTEDEKTDHLPVDPESDRLISLIKKNHRKKQHINRVVMSRPSPAIDFLEQLEADISNESTLSETILTTSDGYNWMDGNEVKISAAVQKFKDAQALAVESVRGMEYLKGFLRSPLLSYNSAKDCKDLRELISNVLEEEILRTTAEINRKLVLVAEKALQDPATANRDKAKIYRLVYGQVCGSGREFPSMVRDDVEEDNCLSENC